MPRLRRRRALLVPGALALFLLALPAAAQPSLRFDGAVARLLVGDEVFTIPRVLLSPDDTGAKRRRLAKDAPGGDIKL